ncbi:MAG: MFS transporter [Candidatus Nitrosocosmicus sp.]|nr:MFS transporter [Candidatus Nitrosocosmicus sp.]MDN5867510.1 MFS transporter [Candidatus Nitrosocosmicus sp.]
METKQITLFPLLFSNFVGTLGFSIVLPFLVFLVVDFGGNSIIYGILSSIYPAFQLIGAPILGRWSDTFGRKKVLLISTAGTLIGWIIFLFALYLPKFDLIDINTALFGAFTLSLPLVVLFVARAIDGITGGNISVANAYIADLSDDKTRSKNFGKMAISSNLGFIVGPALAGILGGTIYGNILPVLVVILVSFVAFVAIGVMLKESNKVAKEVLPIQKNSIQRVFSFECKYCFNPPNPDKLKFKDIFKLKYIPVLMVLNFFIFLGFNIFYTSFPIHAVSSLKWTITEMGIFYAILSGLMILVQGPILRKASQKFSEGNLIIIGSFILGVNFVLFFSSNIILIYVAAILFAVGNGLMWPSFMSVLSRFAGKVHQGAVQGVASSIGSLASIIGLIIGGFLYNSIGSTTFLIAAVIIFVVFALSFKILKIQNTFKAN